MQVWMSHDSGTIWRQCERHLEHSDIPNKAMICPNKGNKNSIKAGAGQSDTASLCATSLRERNSVLWLYSAIYSSSLHWKGRTDLHYSTLTGYLHHQGKPSIYRYARTLPCIYINLECVSLAAQGSIGEGIADLRQFGVLELRSVWNAETAGSLKQIGGSRKWRNPVRRLEQGDTVEPINHIWAKT